MYRFLYNFLVILQFQKGQYIRIVYLSEAGKTIDGHVSVVEPLGAETHVYVATSTAKVIGKIDGTVIPAVDTKISLIPNMEKAKFFDAETELAIR